MARSPPSSVPIFRFLLAGTAVSGSIFATCHCSYRRRAPFTAGRSARLHHRPLLLPPPRPASPPADPPAYRRRTTLHRRLAPPERERESGAGEREVAAALARERNGGEGEERLRRERRRTREAPDEGETRARLGIRPGVFAALEARLAGPSDGGAVSDGCAAAVLALVRFNRDVFVGPVLMGPAVGALVSAASSSSSPSPAPLRALNGLVDAIRTPLVDELHGRGELPRLVALLCAADPRVRALALELVLRVAYYGRGEVLDALLAEGLVKRLLCLQRSDLGAGGSATDTDAEGGETALAASRRPFVSAVARLAVQVEVGQGLGPREKRLAKLDILRRVREAAVSPVEEASVLAEVLWGSTP